MADREMPQFLVICRAAADPEGAHAEARIGMVGEPTPEDIAKFERAIVDLYVHGFDDGEPERVAVAVLPWVDEVDGDGEEADRG